MAKMRGASPSDDTELISAPNTKGTITQVCGSIIKELNTEILLLSKFSHYELPLERRYSITFLSPLRHEHCIYI